MTIFVNRIWNAVATYENADSSDAGNENGSVVVDTIPSDREDADHKSDPVVCSVAVDVAIVVDDSDRIAVAQPLLDHSLSQRKSCWHLLAEID